MMKVFLRSFAFCFLFAFVAEVIMLTTISGDASRHSRQVISEAKAITLVQVIMEETEELEEETGTSRIELDFADVLFIHHGDAFSRFESSVRNFRSQMQLFSRIVPVYTAIHSLLI
jgi:hypothetical protein